MAKTTTKKKKQDVIIDDNETVDGVLIAPETYINVTVPNLDLVHVDVTAPFDWNAIYPQNYFNVKWCKEYHADTGKWPSGFVTGVELAQVQDPEKVPDPNKPLDLVLHLAGLPKIVMNKTRCHLLAKIAGTRDPRKWGAALDGKRLEIYTGVEVEMSAAEQVLIRLATSEVSADDGYY